MKNTRSKVLISSILTIAMCLSIIAGSTFAIFTSESKVDVSVTAANVKISATVLDETLATYSMGVAQAEHGKFENGGSAVFDSVTSTLTLNDVTPGDMANFKIQVTNSSDVTIQYRIKWTVDGKLYEVLEATADGEKLVNNTTEWTKWLTTEESTKTIDVSVLLPLDIGNDYQDESASINFTVEAVQGNAIVSEVASEEQLKMAFTYGNTAMLIGDVTLSESITLPDDGTEYVLYLNGNDIICENGAAIVNSGNLTITNASVMALARVATPAGTVKSTSGNAIKNTGTMVINEGIYESTGTYAINNSGDIVITGASMKTGGIYNTGAMTLNDCTVENTISGRHGIYNRGSELIINGGTYSSTSGNELINADTSKTVINDGTFSMLGKSYLFGGTGIVINDGTFNGYVNADGSNDKMRPGITVNGGTFNFDPTPWTTDGLKGAAATDENGATIYMVIPTDDKVVQDSNGNNVVIPEDNKIMQDTQGNDIIVPEEVDTLITPTEEKTTQQALNEAIAAGKNVYIEEAGKYTIHSSVAGKTVTVSGSKDVIIDSTGAYNFGGANVTLSGVTVQGINADYRGFQHSGEIVFEDCVIDNQIFLYGTKVIFKDCTFNQTSASLYNVWTYSAKNVTFTDCIFNSAGKALLIYSEGAATANGEQTVTIEGCTFNASEPVSGKAAIEIDTSIEKNAVNVIINDTTSTGFAVGSVSGNTLHNQKKGNKAVIVVDGVTFISNGLGKTSDKNYCVWNGTGMEALNAIMVAKSSDVESITLLADIDMTGKTWTPVDLHADTTLRSLNLIDGNGYTISNLTINGRAMFERFAGSAALITVKDLTFDNANVSTNVQIVSIVAAYSYQNVTFDNVDVINSSVTGRFKISPYVSQFYDEGKGSKLLTLKNCDVSNTVLTGTDYNFCTAGMVAFVYADDGEQIAFENCTVDNVTLRAPDDDYDAFAFVYCNDGSVAGSFNEVDGVTVTNSKIEYTNN